MRNVSFTINDKTMNLLTRLTDEARVFYNIYCNYTYADAEALELQENKISTLIDKLQEVTPSLTPMLIPHFHYKRAVDFEFTRQCISCGVGTDISWKIVVGEGYTSSPMKFSGPTLLDVYKSYIGFLYDSIAN